MENYFKVPSVEFLVEFIYSKVVESWEYGEKSYRYRVPYGVSTASIDDIVDKLGERLLDIDVIEHKHQYILIDWS